MRALVGVMPACGRATRLGALPCSKEVLPVRFDAQGPRALCLELLEAFHRGGVQRGIVIVRSGKWDIPAYLGDGQRCGFPLSYICLESSPSIPFTIAAALPFVGDADVALGFPDIVFRPRDGFARMCERHETSGADVTLGLLPSDCPERSDLVELGSGARVRRIRVRPRRSKLRDTWVAAIWGAGFSELLRRFVEGATGEGGGRRAEAGGPGMGREVYPGDVINAAIRAGLVVEAVRLPRGRMIDAGTPRDLARAVAWMAREGEPQDS